MAIKYKMDVLKTLSDRGYSQYKLRREKIMGESTISRLRHGEIVDYNNIEKLCELLNCQIGDLLFYVPDIDKPPYII